MLSSDADTVVPTQPEILWLAAEPQPSWLDELPVRVHRLQEGTLGDAAAAVAIVVESEADLLRHSLSGRPEAILLVGPQTNAPAIAKAIPDVPILRVLELPGGAEKRTLAVGTSAPAGVLALIAESHTVHILELEHVEFVQRMVDLAPHVLRTIQEATGVSFAVLADLARNPPDLSATRGVKLDPDVLDELWDLTAQLHDDEALNSSR